jgi:hypothetical protein
LKTIFALALVAAVASAVPASAVTYDLASSYDGVNNPVGPFTFGYINVATTIFTPFSTGNFSQPCLGNAALSCLTDPIEAAVGAYKNTSGGALNGVVGTIDVPANALFLHPGPTLLSAVAFTSPTATNYDYSLFLKSLTNTNPNGVDMYAGWGWGLTLGAIVPSISLPATLGASFSDSGTILLSAGQTYFIAVGPQGNFNFDSTQLDWSMAAVPEPASWAMLIAGFGLTGAVMRRRRAVAA